MAKSVAGLRPVEFVSVTGSEGALLDRGEAESPVEATPPRAQSGDALRGVTGPLEYPPLMASRYDAHPSSRPGDDVRGDPWVVLDRWPNVGDSRAGDSNVTTQHVFPVSVASSGSWAGTTTSCTWSGGRTVCTTAAPSGGQHFDRATRSNFGLQDMGGARPGTPTNRAPHDDCGASSYDIRGYNTVYSSPPRSAAQVRSYSQSYLAAHVCNGSDSFPAARSESFPAARSDSYPAARSDSFPAARNDSFSVAGPHYSRNVGPVSFDRNQERGQALPAMQPRVCHMTNQPSLAGRNDHYTQLAGRNDYYVPSKNDCGCKRPSSEPTGYVNAVPYERGIRSSGPGRPVYAPEVAVGNHSNDSYLHQCNVHDTLRPHVQFNVANAPHSIYDQHNGPKPSEPIVTSPLTAHINDRVVATALNGEFVDLHECLDSRVEASNVFGSTIDGNGNVIFKSVKPTKYITSVFKWLEAWGYYEMVLGRVLGFDVIHEMACYRTFILNLFQRFKVAHVLSYDYKHRHKLGACRSLDFARVNYDVYLECFDVTALRSTNRCARCGSAEHDNNECPFRPAAASSENLQKRATRAGSSEVCRMFQDGKCRFGKRCHRRHVCATCGGNEGNANCSICQKGRVTTQ